MLEVVVVVRGGRRRRRRSHGRRSSSSSSLLLFVVVVAAGTLFCSTKSPPPKKKLSLTLLSLLYFITMPYMMSQLKAVTTPRTWFLRSKQLCTPQQPFKALNKAHKH